ncbi:uncharacterized protein LOC125676599 [Ostrea edulis]|uniref:uncharacterized protein LOC125676599 n=1 Tax=Ostrea edulis TaxID=37623 RepID=UPI0024AEC69F|nr:uncharacterized protein LOC125676599 [Ostrea edulis]
MLQRNALIVTTLTCMFHIMRGELGCSPNETLQNVPSCPMSRKEIMEAALRLNCQEICKDNRYMYHCLPDNKMEHFFELCAPKVFIIGRRCAEYNWDGNKIQANRYNTRADCSNHTNPCPYVYNSTEAYKYQECFPRPSTNKGSKTKETELNISTAVLSGIIISIVLINGGVLSCLLRVYVCKNCTQQMTNVEENIPMSQKEDLDFEV